MWYTVVECNEKIVQLSPTWLLRYDLPNAIGTGRVLRTFTTEVFEEFSNHFIRTAATTTNWIWS